MKYAVKFEPTRPAGNFRDVIRLRRQWALVHGHAVLRRYATEQSALRALSALHRSAMRATQQREIAAIAAAHGLTRSPDWIV
jgi:hypothetical protein